MLQAYFVIFTFLLILLNAFRIKTLHHVFGIAIMACILNSFMTVWWPMRAILESALRNKAESQFRNKRKSHFRNKTKPQR